MTSEAIAGDPNSMTRNVTYPDDSIGNRTQEVPTPPGCLGGSLNYNATLSTSYNITSTTIKVRCAEMKTVKDHTLSTATLPLCWRRNKEGHQ